jgi:hypothetical protein
MTEITQSPKFVGAFATYECSGIDAIAYVFTKETKRMNMCERGLVLI